MVNNIENTIKEKEFSIDKNRNRDRLMVIGALLGTVASFGIILAAKTIFEPYVNNLSSEQLDDARSIYAGVTLSAMPIGTLVGYLIGERADRKAKK